MTTLADVLDDDGRPPNAAPGALRARISLEAINGTRPVWIGEGVFEKFAARTVEGWPVTIEWGEPDTDGFYSPVFTEHPTPPDVLDDGGRPPLPAETVAYDKGVMAGYLAAKKDYSPGGMYASPTPPDALDPCPHCVMQHVWPCPTIRRCDEPGCDRETSCGFPTPSGYRRTCGDHYRAALEANHAPHLLPEADHATD